MASKNWISSVEKWERCVRLAEKKKLMPYNYGDCCGFCSFYQTDIIEVKCRNCPLYPIYCPKENSIFYQIFDAFFDGDYHRTKVLCRGMLNEILCNEF